MDRFYAFAADLLLLGQTQKKCFAQVSATLESKLCFSDIDTLDEFAENIFDFQDANDAECWWDGRYRMRQTWIGVVTVHAKDYAVVRGGAIELGLNGPLFNRNQITPIFHGVDCTPGLIIGS